MVVWIILKKTPLLELIFESIPARSLPQRTKALRYLPVIVE